MKSAAVFALDVSCANPSSLAMARQVCLHMALETLLYAPSDELGLVLGGTADTLNPLHTADPSGERYRHITVAQEVNKASNSFLEPLLHLDPAGPAPGCCDVLELLSVSAHQLHVRTAKKKYARRIYLLTDAKDEVQHKQEITTSIEYLRSSGVSVVVVGLDFTEDDAQVQGRWEGLGTKAENERVLHYLCQTLHETDGASAVVSLQDTLEGLEELRRRKVLQRGLAKLVLTIGEVKIATQIYSKIVPEKIPPLKKMTSDGADVGQKVTFARVGDVGDVGTSAAGGQETVTADGLVRALRYGRSLIPCSDADVEAMKIKGRRGLEGVGFASQHEIPPYIATGACKSLLPLLGDDAGQRAFACLVEAMLRKKVALVVRYVSRTDAKPALGVCMPARKESTGQYVLYYAPLPFTEDVRLYRFSQYQDVVFTDEEEALMDSLVNAMTVDRDTLRLRETFNPEIHQYYATVRQKVLEAVRETLGAQKPKKSRNETTTDAAREDVPELLPQLQRTSAAFASRGNQLYDLLASAKPLLESCAMAFPFVEVDAEGSGGSGGAGARGAWFNASAAALHSTTAAAALVDDGATSLGAPTTVAAPALVAGGMSGVSMTRQAGSEAAASSVSTIAATAGLSSGKADHVNSIDPVGSFRALIEAAPHDPAARALAMDDLVRVVFDLLQHSIKDSLYSKCDDCVRALREHCVREEEPAYYNTFLSKLQATAQELELGEAYWTAHIVHETSTHPITRLECKSSTIANEQAAREFMTQDRALPAVDLQEDDDDDLMALIV